MAIDSVIFGFGYRARSGKDTAVAEIIKQRGLLRSLYVKGDTGDLPVGTTYVGVERYDIRRYAFADALKREVNALAAREGGMEKLFSPNYSFPKQGYVMVLPEWVKYDPNPDMSDPLCPLGKQRALLQFYGTEYRRADDDNYWVRQLALRIELEKPQIALITDMRFPNEMKFVKQFGETVRVDRAGLPPSTHASETALADTSDEDWSIILENNGTVEEFKEGAVTTFDELMTNFPFGHNKH